MVLEEHAIKKNWGVEFAILQSTSLGLALGVTLAEAASMRRWWSMVIMVGEVVGFTLP